MTTNNELTTVYTKAKRSNGVTYPPSQTGFYVRFAGKGSSASITVYRMNDKTKEIERCDMFKVGDMAEWGSYNLSYYGRIMSITEKSVTIAHTDRPGQEFSSHRLDLHTFCWRNHNFDYATTRAKNREEMMYL